MGDQPPCADCAKNYPDPCSKHCTDRQNHIWLAGVRCDTCDTYFRGDSMG